MAWAVCFVDKVALQVRPAVFGSQGVGDDAAAIEEMAEFWDTHDVTDFEDETYEVEMEFDIQFRSHFVAIDPDLLQKLRKAAASRGLSTESLVNLWLQEKLLSPP